ncbi:hypothetical protein Tcan_07621 [Toxocara canis]|uniref:Uncharacterized protein n=1 Tax=Toxocara canis TaxID=6265 RepID=A0A0B2V287_TOXCA|nr:hypothetical protein Tcan_07621 [Toxocara canis]
MGIIEEVTNAKPAGPRNLENNFGLCVGRLKTSLRRLQKNPELLCAYQKTFDEQLKMGIIEEVTNAKPAGPRNLENNFGLCVGRLKTSLRRLQKNPELLCAYQKTFDEQLKMGIIEEVTNAKPAGPRNLENNFGLCVGRLKTSLRRLQKNPELLCAYQKTFDEQLKMGIIEEVTNAKPAGPRNLENNFGLCVGRLKTSLRRLQKNPELLCAYQKTFDEQLKMGIIEEVTNAKPAGPRNLENNFGLCVGRLKTSLRRLQKNPELLCAYQKTFDEQLKMGIIEEVTNAKPAGPRNLENNFGLCVGRLKTSLRRLQKNPELLCAYQKTFDEQLKMGIIEEVTNAKPAGPRNLENNFGLCVGRLKTSLRRLQKNPELLCAYQKTFDEQLKMGIIEEVTNAKPAGPRNLENNFGLCVGRLKTSLRRLQKNPELLCAYQKTFDEQLKMGIIEEVTNAKPAGPRNLENNFGLCVGRLKTSLRRLQKNPELLCAYQKTFDEQLKMGIIEEVTNAKPAGPRNLENNFGLCVGRLKTSLRRLQKNPELLCAYQKTFDEQLKMGIIEEVTNAKPAGPRNLENNFGLCVGRLKTSLRRLQKNPELLCAYQKTFDEQLKMGIIEEVTNAKPAGPRNLENNFGLCVGRLKTSLRRLQKNPELLCAYQKTFDEQLKMGIIEEVTNAKPAGPRNLENNFGLCVGRLKTSLRRLQKNPELLCAYQKTFDEQLKMGIIEEVTNAKPAGPRNLENNFGLCVGRLKTSLRRLQKNPELLCAYQKTFDEQLKMGIIEEVTNAKPAGPRNLENNFGLCVGRLKTSLRRLQKNPELLCAYQKTFDEQLKMGIIEEVTNAKPAGPRNLENNFGLCVGRLKTSLRRLQKNPELLCAYQKTFDEQLKMGIIEEVTNAKPAGPRNLENNFGLCVGRLKTSLRRLQKNPELLCAYQKTFDEQLKMGIIEEVTNAKPAGPRNLENNFGLCVGRLKTSLRRLQKNPELLCAYQKTFDEQLKMGIIEEVTNAKPAGPRNLENNFGLCVGRLKTSLRRLQKNPELLCAYQKTFDEQLKMGIIEEVTNAKPAGPRNLENNFGLCVGRLKTSLRRLQKNPELLCAYQKTFDEQLKMGIIEEVTNAKPAGPRNLENNFGLCVGRLKTSLRRLQKNPELLCAYQKTFDEQLKMGIIEEVTNAKPAGPRNLENNFGLCVGRLKTSLRRLQKNPELLCAYQKTFDEQLKMGIIEEVTNAKPAGPRNLENNFGLCVGRLKTSLRRLQKNPELLCAYQKTFDEQLKMGIIEEVTNAKPAGPRNLENNFGLCVGRLKTSLRRLQKNPELLCAYQKTFDEQLKMGIIEEVTNAKPAGPRNLENNFGLCVGRLKTSLRRLQKNPELLCAYQKTFDEQLKMGIIEEVTNAKPAGPRNLENNFGLCVGRLKTSLRRLQKNPELLCAYQKTFDEQLKMGIIEEVTNAKPAGPRNLENNFGLCVGRLKTSLRRLQKNPELLCAYQKTFDEQLKMGIIEEVTNAKPAGPRNLENNFGLCVGRLKTSLRRLQKNPELLCAYQKTFDEQLKMGIIEEVTNAKPAGPRNLENNFGLCVGRLKTSLRRLQKNPELLCAYQKTFDEQLKMGIIEEVTNAKPAGPRNLENNFGLCVGRP